MNRLSAGAGQPERSARRWQSYRVGWVATLIATVALLVVIVVAAALDGLRIASQRQTIRIMEANIPVREQMYPGSILRPPTVVSVPRSDRGEVAPDSAFVVPTVVAIPHSKVEDLLVTVNPQETAKSLFSGPGTEYAVLRELAPGEQVQLLTSPIEIRGQQWQLIRASDAQVGWCMPHWLSPIAGK